MVVSPEESTALYHIRSQRTRITQDGKPSTMMGTPSFGALESIRLPHCTPRLCATSTKLGMNWERSFLFRGRWCQQINERGIFLFRCVFPRQCT